MKRFNIFDPLASDSNQSKDDDNDGDPHRLVVMDGAKVDNALVPCDYCERTFSADRIKKHLEARTIINYNTLNTVEIGYYRILS